MKRVITRILQSKCFESQPPVLLDIGASGGLPRQWRVLAPYSIGIGFDADSREFSVEGSEKKGWRRLHLLNRLVTAEQVDSVDFYLTSSPYCSSTLRPLNDELRPWAFRRLFNVDRAVRLPAIDLPSALAQAGVNRVDWFKCDSQGTDLRLFRSLPPDMQAHVLAADFEPGIIDAYSGEDKLPQLMTYMESLPFWVSGMVIRGSQRIGDLSLDDKGAILRRMPMAFYRTSPGWCEISYLNTCATGDMSERDLLLAIAFALVQRQYGFAADLAARGAREFGGELFDAVQTSIRRRLRLGYFRIWPVAVKSIVRRLA